MLRCCCYHKGTYFQANHNNYPLNNSITLVVVATTKVRIFKQITTEDYRKKHPDELLLLPQRYVFSSKSQLLIMFSLTSPRCCCYHKGTYFQANHNKNSLIGARIHVVVATTKVRIFKQITTIVNDIYFYFCCCCYHKGTYFQANHNPMVKDAAQGLVVVATTKVRIFKQITTQQ